MKWCVSELAQAKRPAYAGLLGILICLGMWHSAVLHAKTRVAFLGPPVHESIFWDKLKAPMQSCARDQGISLEVVTTPFSNRFDYLRSAEKIAQSSSPPDYLITMFRGASALPLLNMLKKYRLKLVSINSPIDESEREIVGLPREKFHYWAGQIYYDDEQAGYALMDELIHHARQKFQQPRLTLVALSGDHVLSTSALRDRGRMKRLKQAQGIEYLQSVTADWNYDKAFSLTLGLLNRYDSVNIVWAANDDIALGAADAFVQRGFEPGSDNFPIIGGIDGLPTAIAAIKEEKLTLSLGGNHLQGCHALDLIAALSAGKTHVMRTQIYTYNRVNPQSAPTEK